MANLIKRKKLKILGIPNRSAASVGRETATVSGWRPFGRKGLTFINDSEICSYN